jgi:catechol 2,3-dioxygenase-like lactoylglutathione lyase family enzyme
VGSIRLDQVNLVVTDVDTSRAFYTHLGLDFGAERDPEWGAHHVSARQNEDAALDVDLDSTAFVADWDRGWPGGTGVVLGFKVETRDEVDRLVADLTADGVVLQQPPFDAFWGARYAVVSDPDGNAVGIMSPVDPARRSAHPPPT